MVHKQEVEQHNNKQWNPWMDYTNTLLPSSAASSLDTLYGPVASGQSGRKKGENSLSTRHRLIKLSYLVNEATSSSYFGQEVFFVFHHPGHALLVLQSLLSFNFHVADLQKKADSYILDTHLGV